MSDTFENLARSLTADSVDLIPHLPYLLQDFWELGSSPEDMLHLFKKHITLNPGMRILDLACGKGAVSIQLAQELAIHFKGVDFFPEFIDEARSKALEMGVADRCRFEVGDANDSLKTERDYDGVIFGAVGNIFGDYPSTLRALTAVVKKGGYLLIDDAYVLDRQDNKQLRLAREYPTYEEWRAMFRELNLEIIDCLLPSEDSPDDGFEEELNWIRARAEELKRIHPAKQALFDKYVENQRNEYLDLQQGLTGATWLVRAGDF